MNACDGTNDATLSLDKALSLARQGISVWRSLVACPNCPYHKDQEVVMLAYMGIRALTRYLQRLGPRYIPHLRQDPDVIKSFAAKEDLRLVVGSVEVDGDERDFVFRVLFQNMLQNVQETLHALQAVQSKRKGLLLQETSSRAIATEDYQLSSSLLHVQQMSHTLVKALNELK